MNARTLRRSPMPIANVKRERQSSVRCWLFWSTIVTEEVREPIACPNCGRKQCAITKREPIAKEPATEVAVGFSYGPPVFDLLTGKRS